MNAAWLTSPILWTAWLACLVLTGIHAYLGIHVIRRGVIFVDLALAQIAALGATVALLFGFDSGAAEWSFSLGFTLVGAAVFSLTRSRTGRVPQEAIIGIVYAVTSALVIVVLAAAEDPHAGDHLRDLLAGNVLLVTWAMVTKTAALYVVLGAVHFLCRRPLLEITDDAESARRNGRSLVVWDFVFYATFGVAITSSVQIAGVLLVFTLLVVPAVFAVLFAESLRARLAIGWTLGAVVSFVGLAFSYELPSGPVIVAAFGATLLVAGLVRHVVHAPRRAVALSRIGVGFGVVTLLLFAAFRLRPEDHDPDPEPEPARPAEVTPDERAAAEDLIETDLLLEMLEFAERDSERLRYAAALFRRGVEAGRKELRRLAEEGDADSRARAARLLE